MWATINVHAMTHAAAAVIPAIVRHASPHDVSVLDGLAERSLEKLVCSLVPGVVALRTPRWGAARRVVVLSIEAGRSARAVEIANAVRGLHGLARSKCVVLVDEGIMLDEPEALLTAVIEQISPTRDVRFVDTALDPDDPSVAESGSAVIIDATSTVSSHPMRKARPSPAVAEAVRKMLGND